LHQKKMNDLVYLMYNLKLKSRQIQKIVVLPFDDIESDDEWIIEEANDVVKIVQVEGQIDVQNVPLDGATIDPALDALDLDNITFDANEDAQVSLGKNLDEDDDGDNDVIRELDIDISHLNLCFTVFVWTYLFEVLLNYIIFWTYLN